MREGQRRQRSASVALRVGHGARGHDAGPVRVGQARVVAVVAQQGASRVRPARACASLTGPQVVSLDDVPKELRAVLVRQQHPGCSTVIMFFEEPPK